MPPLFVPLSGQLMASDQGRSEFVHNAPAIEQAEALLGSLTGILSARIVTGPDGEIEEVHILTTDDVQPKQTVRNVESALLAHLDMAIDHRKISVAQTRDGQTPTAPPADAGALNGVGRARPTRDRILLLEHHVESEPVHRVRMRVALEWTGERFEGEASGTDLPRIRLETISHATLRAVELAMRSRNGEGRPQFALALDGVKIVEAFERRYVLVAVHAITGRGVIGLAGAADVDDTADRAVILATLQAADRWARGRA